MQFLRDYFPLLYRLSESLRSLHVVPVQCEIEAVQQQIFERYRALPTEILREVEKEVEEKEEKVETEEEEVKEVGEVEEEEEKEVEVDD